MLAHFQHSSKFISIDTYSLSLALSLSQKNPKQNPNNNSYTNCFTQRTRFYSTVLLVLCLSQVVLLKPYRSY